MSVNQLTSTIGRPSAGQIPVFGLAGQHFTHSEVLWLVHNCEFEPTPVPLPSEEQRLRRLLADADAWQRSEPDLSVYESLPVDQQLNRPWFPPRPPKSKDGPRRSIPGWWYVISLANYGRIRLSYEFLVKSFALPIHKWPDEGKALVNQSELEMVWDKFVNGLHRSNATAGSHLIPVLWRFILWAGVPLSEACRRIDEYEVLAHTHPATREHGLTAVALRRLRKTLAQIFPYVSSRAYFTKDRRIIAPDTDSPDLLQAYHAWTAHLELTKAHGTVEGKRKNTRLFLNWLSAEHPEIEHLAQLERAHIKEYISYLDDYVKPDGDGLVPETRNGRLREVAQWFEWLGRSHPALAPGGRLVSPYDTVRETGRLPRQIPKSEARLLFRAINSLEDSSWFRPKMALIILADSGQRLHEVLHLAYKPLVRSSAPSGWDIVFHKRKGQGSFQTPANPLTVQCVRILQEHFQGVTSTIPSKLDGRDIRRLFPGDLLAGVLTHTTVYEAMHEAQRRVGLLDEDGDPKYTPHDLRRIFVSGLLDQGVPYHEIAKLVGHKNPQSLIAYEDENPKATRVYVAAAESGILTGPLPEAVQAEQQTGRDLLSKELIDLLRDIDVRQRHHANMQRLQENEAEAWPVYTGHCVGGGALTCFADDLTCLGCRKLTEVKQDQVDEYLKRAFLQNWRRRKAGVSLPEEITSSELTYGDGDAMQPDFESRILRIRDVLYVEKLGMTEAEAETHLNRLEAMVVPKRGRPRKDR